MGVHLQPLTRMHVADADHGAREGFPCFPAADTDVAVPQGLSVGAAWAEGLCGAGHAALELEGLPRSPETIPITLAALTYGRHAAAEGCAPGPSISGAQGASEDATGRPAAEGQAPIWTERCRRPAGAAS